MGYRSEIVIAIRPDVYENAPQNVKDSFDCLFFDEMVKDEIRIVFYAEGIKWYDVVEGDHSVETIEKWLETLDKEEYGLVELGEDDSDVRFDGDPMSFDIGYVRKVTF